MPDLILTEVENKLSEIFLRRIQIHSSQTLGGGCINHASKIESSAGTFFLKWNANCPSDMFAREAEGLQALKTAAGGLLRIPEVIGWKDSGTSPGFIVLSFLEEAAPLAQADEQLGRGLATVHKFRAVKYGFAHNNYCGATPQKNTFSDSWPEFFRTRRLEYLLQLIENQRELSKNDRAVYSRLLDRLPVLIPSNTFPSLIHGDLWSGNFMHTKSGPALIDPAAYYADREMEFAIITMFGGFSSHFFAAYNEAFPLEPDWRERNRLYQLYHILNHYFLFGGAYGSQALAVAKSYL